MLKSAWAQAGTGFGRFGRASAWQASDTGMYDACNTCKCFANHSQILAGEAQEVNSIHYNAALAACDTKTWQGAGTLLANMRHRLLSLGKTQQVGKRKWPVPT